MIHMFDAGGSNSEQEKWIHCFESLISVFCRALSKDEQVLLEESKTVLTLSHFWLL